MSLVNLKTIKDQMGIEIRSLCNRLGLEHLNVIDCHGHLGQYGGFNVPMGDAASMVDTMDRLGIDLICISSHVAIGPDFRYGNDLTLEAMQSYPDRFVGYCVVNPNYSDEMISELERCCGQLGMSGIKLHPSASGYPIDGPNHWPAYEYADIYGLPVLIHCGGVQAIEGCVNMAKKYQNAKFLVGHAGGDYAGICHAIHQASELNNLFLDFTGSRPYFGILERACNILGPERLLYGSDLPFIDPRPQLGHILYSKLDDRAKAMILGVNMMRILCRNTLNSESQ